MLTAFILICIHYIANFICQDQKWALNKSKSNLALVKHTATYTYVFMLIYCFIYFFGGFSYEESIFKLKFLLFFPITFLTHTAVDYITSRIVSKRFADKYLGSSIPNFGAFSIIGLDQVIHYGILFLTYHFLIY